MKECTASRKSSGRSSCGMCPTPGISTSHAPGSMDARRRLLLTGTMASPSPWMISTRTPLPASASTTLSSAFLFLSAASSPASSSSSLAAAAANTLFLPPVTAANTTRNMPWSQPITAEGRRYPSTHEASIRDALPLPTAWLRPLRQNAAERTICRKNRMMKGPAAYTTPAVSVRTNRAGSAARTRRGRVSVGSTRCRCRSAAAAAAAATVAASRAFASASFPALATDGNWELSSDGRGELGLGGPAAAAAAESED
mmetsp:Transcript_15829/g.38540  ORF Transcript_15829/g.38540 Transcript_15829/m.38540 type:complete len:256 (+) Transcript_15829:180-947(+)